MLLLPHTALAQGARSLSEVTTKHPVINTLLLKIMNVIVIPIIEGLFIFTFFMFVWGVVQMIRNADDPSAREDGQRHILWSVIGMFIMVSAYGIVRVIANTVGGMDV
jgi:hypothetical protein